MEKKRGGFSFGFLRKEKMIDKQKQQQEEERMKKMKEGMMKEMKEEEERIKKMKEEMKEEMMKDMKQMKEEEERLKKMKEEMMKEEEERMNKMKEEIMKEEEERRKKMKEEMKEEIKEEMMKKMKEEMKKMKEEEEDSVWGNFIPSIYFEIIAKSSLSSSSPSSSTTMTSTSLLGGFSSKKDLCCSLFDKLILIEDDSKSFGIEKRSAKICFMLGARALSIEWGSNPTYWTWRPSSNESRFPEVANLLKVSWLAITGKVETQMLSPKTMYGAYFVIKIAEQNYGLDRLPVQFSMRFVRGDGECSEARKVFLKRGETQQQGEFPHERGDGWMEIEMGEFFNDGEEDGEVEMHLFETDSHWKCGLIVQGIELRPKVST